MVYTNKFYRLHDLVSNGKASKKQFEDYKTLVEFFNEGFLHWILVTNNLNNNIMKIINRYCDDLDEASELQEKLYEKYNSVECVNEPMFSEHGIYTFKVE